MAIWQRLERSSWAMAALLLLAALAVRWPAFGEWNYAIDDQYFALVGRRLLAGDLLYVDIWDRKPPLLYLTYAAIAALSPAVLAYQLVATLCCAAGAWLTACIARLIAPLPAALMAGIAYPVLMTRFGGGNGEAAIFYNPLILFTAWAIASSVAQLRSGALPRRVPLGMFSAGLAIAYKQSALFEALFFGIAVLVLLKRDGVDARALLLRALAMAAIGALPVLAIGLFYAAIGHFDALLRAVVLSNFTRAYDGGAGRAVRALAMTALLALPLLFAVLGWWRARAERPAPLAFLTAWALVAIAGVAIFPSLYLHYALPLIAPLMVLSAPFFARPGIGAIGFAALALINLATADMFDLATRRAARPAAAALLAEVRADTPDRRLLVFGMPSYLYALVGAAPPRPLAFPPHLYEGAESRASGIDEVAALAAALRAGPETLVVQEPLPAWPRNRANVAQLAVYARHCRAVRRMPLHDHAGQVQIAVYHGCAALAGSYRVR